MRVTNLTLAQNAIRHMEENRERLDILREKVASGKQFQNPSENPSAVSKVLDLRSALKSSQSYLDTAYIADEWMSAVEVSLGQMTEIAKRSLNLAMEGMSDTVGPNERQNALGPELQKLLENAIDIANHTHQGKYIFAGHQIYTRPFSLSGPTTLNPYAGDSGQIRMEIGVSQSITVNLDGNVIFTPLMEAIRDACNALTAPVFNFNDLGNAIDRLQQSLETINGQRASFGTRQRQVKNTIGFIEKTQFEMKKLLSTKEDTSLAEAISMLRNQETTYQTVLEVSSRAISAANLFDYLR